MDFPEDDPGSTTGSSSPWPALGAAMRRRWSTTPSRTPWWSCSAHRPGQQVYRREQALGTGQDEAQKPRLAHVLYNLLEACAFPPLLTPFMPETCGKIFAQLGVARRAHLGVR